MNEPLAKSSTTEGPLERIINEQRTILNTVQIGISYVKARKFQWINPAFLKMFGYESSDELAGQEALMLYVNQEDYQRIGNEGYARLAEAKVYTTEVIMKRKDGSPFWCNLTGQAINPQISRDESIWVFQDITERKRTQDALLVRTEQIKRLASEQRTTLNAIQIGISYIKERKVQWVNPAWLNMFGFKNDEDLTELSTSKLYMNQEDYHRVGSEGYGQLLEGKVYTTEAIMKRKDGSAFWCCLTGQAIDPQTGRDESIWVLQDITERKQNEEILQANEERFQRLIQNSNDIIMVLDGNGTQLSILGPFERITGFKPEEVIGMDGFEWVHPEDRPAVKKIFEELVKRPGETKRAEYRTKHVNGSWPPVEAVGTNLLQDPLVKGVVVNIRDISERNKLQDQLQQAMKMEAIGRLAGGVAHDFNNLLTTIIGNADLARIDLAPSDPLITNLDGISRAAKSASSLTRQLLAFSRRQIIEPVVLDLNDLIENTQKMLARLIGEDVALQTNLHPDLGSVKIDPGQFEQVLVNLSVNARDAMPEGGKLLVETANVDLDEEYCTHHPEARSNQCVLLTVSDTGQGMNEEVKKHLFEPFFTTKPKGRGTGLGLATIFGAVKQAGGHIEVYSEIGLGTTFKIYLPRTDIQPEKLVLERNPQRLIRGSETVLLVEDETAVRELSALALERLGYKVLNASNGGEAFMLAEKTSEHIHLLLTDVVMPGMNGRELSVRLLKLHPEMKVLFTSGYTEDVVVHHGVLEKNLNFIAKPYTVQSLAKKIREVLQQTGPAPS